MRRTVTRAAPRACDASNAMTEFVQLENRSTLALTKHRAPPALMPPRLGHSLLESKRQANEEDVASTTTLDSLQKECLHGLQRNLGPKSSAQRALGFLKNRYYVPKSEGISRPSSRPQICSWSGV